MSDFNELTITDLQTVIENAEKALKTKLVGHRKEVIAQIKELAASIDVIVEISETEKPSARKGVKVPAKYRHPTNSDKTWTGRGMKPTWLKELINAGHDLSEFLV